MCRLLRTFALALVTAYNLLSPDVAGQQTPDSVGRNSIVSGHNGYRRAEYAANMQTMKYSAYLEDMALEWAKRCVFQHGHARNSSRAAPPWSWIGQNLYAVSVPKVNYTRAVLVWSVERASYNISSGKCAAGRVCGHYTQMVWSDSANIGCAGVVCPVLNDTAFTNAGFIVCNYGPGGNYVGEKPYIYGQPCSTCANNCISGLCG